MADDESGAVTASHAAFKAPAAARSPLEENASPIGEAADDSAGGGPAAGGRGNRAPYFVSCSDACFCAFCILFVVALSLSFALGIAYVQGAKLVHVQGDVVAAPGAANYSSILSSALAGLRRHGAPFAGSTNGTSGVG
ncbi:uncharacterized protein LOC144123206 isoform X1 [Amblyomma americanum]